MPFSLLPLFSCSPVQGVPGFHKPHLLLLRVCNHARFVTGGYEDCWTKSWKNSGICTEFLGNCAKKDGDAPCRPLLSSVLGHSSLTQPMRSSGARPSPCD